MIGIRGDDVVIRVYIGTGLKNREVFIKDCNVNSFALNYSVYYQSE